MPTDTADTTEAAGTATGVTTTDGGGSGTGTGALTLRGLTKSFGVAENARTILAPTDLDLQPGQFVALLGPSGCGKSTLLSMVAGLSEATAGEMTLEGAPITGPGADRGVVFQEHVLLPWLTARGNVRFALDCARPELTPQERDDLAVEALEKVHLTDAMDRRPSALSGGMQQRVSVARAFALAPKVLLLDEPFGALDALTRVSLQSQLLELWEADRRTVIMVTHDVEEAVLLADRILVMSSGPDAVIQEDVTVPFDRPRRAADLRRDAQFNDLTARLVEQLVQQHH